MSDEALQLISGADFDIGEIEFLPPLRRRHVFTRLVQQIKLQFFAGGRQSVPAGDEPWRAIPKVTASSGPVTSIGTGFFVKPLWVVTAGHVIWEGQYQVGAHPTITVQAPLGGTAFADYVMHPSYNPNVNGQAFDIALLKVRAGLPTGGTYFSLYRYLDDFLQGFIKMNFDASVAGYPQDLGYQLVEAHNRLESFDASYIYHDVECAKGESGAPLMYRNQNGFAPLGVHAYGGGPGRANTATRLNDDMLKWVLSTIAANP